MSENEKTNSDTKKNGKDEKPKTEPKDNLVETKHSVTINGQVLTYTVTTGTIVLKEETEKEGKAEGETPKAAFFFVAYTRDDVEDVTTRPLTFSFNGGPGSSSVWMHLGVLGPRRILTDEKGNLLQPPYKLIDNEYSILDQTAPALAARLRGKSRNSSTAFRKTSNLWVTSFGCMRRDTAVGPPPSF